MFSVVDLITKKAAVWLNSRDGNLHVNDKGSQKTAFGESSVSTLSPIVQASFVYNINPEIWDSNLNGGSAAVTNHMLDLSTGAAGDQSAAMFSRVPIKYSPGMGGLVRFSALFTFGVTGSTQLVGVGDISDGFAFGFLDSDFGLFRIAYGHSEYQKLTITTASITNENVTVTLDGETVSVPVTNTGNITQTVNELATFDYSLVGSGWNSHAEGSSVMFTSFRARLFPGIFSLTGATTAAGVFNLELAGVAPTVEFVKQIDWNRNKLTELNPLLGNVYQIRYQWLGFGSIDFSIEDETTGELVLVHTIEYSNKNVLPSINNPSLPLVYFVENSTNVSNISIKSGSIAGFIEGEEIAKGVQHGVSSSKSGVTTIVPVVTIHNPNLYKGLPNRTTVNVNLIDVAVDGTKESVVRIFRNPVLIDTSFSPLDVDTTVVEVDTSATVVSGGDELFAFLLSKTDSRTLSSAGRLSLELRPNDFLSVTVESASNTDTLVTINMEDIF